MIPRTNLNELLITMQPVLNNGEFVFCSVGNMTTINLAQVLFMFREAEGITIIVSKAYADEKQLSYDYVASWITLNVFSSLEATGLTAAFSTALSNNNISCNVVAAYNHDHIFVAVKDGVTAVKVLEELSVKAAVNLI